MNYEQFAIWLHGFLEISNAETINEQQTQIIKDHLALLFEKKTPDRSKKKEEKSEFDPFEQSKKLEEQWKKRRPKDTEYPIYPPLAPMPTYPMPIYPELPPKIICSDGTGSPLSELGTPVCSVADKHKELMQKVDDKMKENLNEASKNSKIKVCKSKERIIC